MQKLFFWKQIFTNTSLAMFNFLTVLGTPEVPVIESRVDCVFDGNKRRPKMIEVVMKTPQSFT